MKKNYRNSFPLYIISALEQTNWILQKSVLVGSRRSWLITFSLAIAAITAYGQCSISISKVTTSGCYSVSGVSKATVSVEVAWSNAPTGQYIIVTTGAQSETIIPGTRTVTYTQPPGVGSLTGQQTIVSPQVVAFEVNANSATASIVARFSTTTSCSATSSYTAPAPCLPTVCSGNNVGGIVFKDFNDDGQKAVGETAGIPAVSVIGIACDGTVYTTTTDNYGRYSLAVPANKYPVRVEFSNVPGVYNLGVNGSDSRTTVQFVSAPDCNVDLGIFNPVDYCSNNPVVFVPCYVNGDPLVAGNSGTSTALVTIPYAATNITPTSDEKEIAKASQVGSIWGLAYNKYTKRLFQSAVLKRHAGLGPIGLGGIYVTNYTNTSSPTTTTFVNVSSLGINVGTIAANSGSANRGMSGDKGSPNRDTPAFANTGKIGIGDLELSEDGDKLWLVNLNDKKLYSIDISQYNADGITKPTAANVTSFSIPASCSGGSYRPWALKVYNGKVYVGGGCDASGGSKSNLRASVYELNGSTFTQIFDFPLTYPKGYPANANRDITGWYPWSDDFNVVSNGGANFYRYPVPIFTDIEFDIDGSMVLAFGDRTGFQGGDENYRPDNTSTALYSVNSQAGDILRAYYSNGAFVLENDAKAGPALGYGAGNSQGPGFGEFYNDNWIQDQAGGGNNPPFYHAENIMGGLALKPGSGEVVAATVDPVDYHPFAGGVRYLNNSSGRSTKSYSVYVTRGPDGEINPGTFAKATGLGDIELGCNTIDLLQIGNRVWQDDDRDGEQDACEKGLSHVIVSLYRSGTLIARTTTDDNGEYYFPNYANPSSVTYAGSTTALVANTAYQLVFGTNGQYVNGTGVLTVSNGKYLLTTANATGGNKNDSNDSDAQVATVGGITAPVISLTTGDLGMSNHTFDVGFYCQPTQYGSVSVTPASCSGNVASSNARIALNGIVNADKVFLVTAGNTIPSYTATSSQPVSASAVSFTGLTNPTSSSGTSYSLVLYNGPCCYTITTALLPRTDCSCALSLSVLPAPCNPVNNQYSVSGTLNLSNTPATSFTVSDGVRSTVVSVTIGQTSAPFSLTGLTSGTNSHTVTVISSGTACGSASQTYSAPGSCTVPASVTVSSASVCYGSSATLIASGCSGTVTWSNNTTGTSLVVQSLTATTNYTATCATVSQTATTVGTVTVYNRPVVVIQASSTLVTVNTPVSLTASGCTGTLAWSMGGNSAVMSVTPSQSSNTYSVTCTTGPGCFTTASITVNTAPRATVQVTSATVCAGSPASLTASGCNGTLQWSGNGVNSTSTILTVTTSSTITAQTVLSYTVTCTGQTSATFAVGTVTVVPNPVMAVIPPSQTIVQGQPANLTATGCSNGVLTWSTGVADNNKTVITVMPMSVGNTVYSVTCTVSPGCVGAASAIVSVVPATTLTVNSATVCAGSIASLTAIGCTGNMVWSGSGANNSTSNVLTINTSSTITTQQVLSYTATCSALGNASVTTTVTVVPTPTLSLTGIKSTTGNSMTLVAIGCAGGSVRWSTGATATSIVITPGATTLYSATCTVPPSCSQTARLRVGFVPTNLDVVTSGANICAGQSVTLTASNCTADVTWNTGATGASLVVSPAITTGYSVTCSDDVNTAIASTTVVVSSVPTIALSASSQTLTAGGSVTLTASGCQSGTVVWSTGVSGQMSIVVSPTTNSAYSATCTTGPQCATSTNINLQVNLLPTLSLTKLVNKSKAQLGDVISYTVILANSGPGVASNVVVRDSISAGLAIVPGSMSASVGSFTIGNPISLWGIASLPANTTATLMFSASATEEGVVYNRATIPGDTATVCTSIPIKVCKGTDYAVEVSAPAGYTRYQWYRRSGTAQDVLVYDGTLNSYTATVAGEYRVVVNDVQGLCPNLSCCPVVIEEDSIPAFTVMAKSPTCLVNQPQPNGSLTLMGLGQNLTQYTYAISEGNSFTGVNPTQLPIPANGIIASTLSTAKTYTVRVYNALGCYRDVIVTLTVNCECPAEICVPVVLKKTKSRVQTP